MCRLLPEDYGFMGMRYGSGRLSIGSIFMPFPCKYELLIHILNFHLSKIGDLPMKMFHVKFDISRPLVCHLIETLLPNRNLSTGFDVLISLDDDQTYMYYTECQPHLSKQSLIMRMMYNTEYNAY